MVFDGRLGRFAVYRITGNRLVLHSVREVSPDLELGSYGPQVPSPEDILVVFAGGAEASTCAVIPSWGPKVGSTAVTRAVR